MIPPALLLQAYAQGYFPMADEDGELGWYTADPRAILPLDPFHIPRRLRSTLRNAPFTYTRDREFEAVMRGCADRPSSWINETLIRSYVGLHRSGFAHSVEVWQDAELVGGVYGVHIGAAFFAESMFRRVDNASKGALVHLAQHLIERGFRLLEIQMITPGTATFGARPITRAEYLPLLEEAISQSCEW